MQTSRVEGSERCELAWLQAAVDEGCESGDVSRVEDHDNVLNVWAVFLDVLTEVCGNLAVAFQQVLTCHASLTGSTTRGDDVFSACESLLGSLCDLLGVVHVLYRGSVVAEVCTGNGALLHLVVDTMNTRLIDIVETNVRSKAEHKSALHQV